VFFHYGQPSIKSHLQAEVLNYSVFYNSTDVTHDPGTVGYGSPLHRNYYTQGLCHNVPLINGEGQEQPPKGRRPDPFAKTRAGELLEFSADPPRVSAAHPVYRHDAKARRTLRIEKDRLIDEVDVESTTGDAQKLGLALHVGGNVQLPKEFKQDKQFADGRPAPFEYWTDARTATYHDEAGFDIDYGKVPIRITFATPGEFRIWHASTPDSPPYRRESFYIEKLASKTHFSTTFRAAGP
jgi:hypothetical protein